MSKYGVNVHCARGNGETRQCMPIREFIIFFEIVRTPFNAVVALNTKQRMHLKEVVNLHSTFREGIKLPRKRRKYVSSLQGTEYTRKSQRAFSSL